MPDAPAATPSAARWTLVAAIIGSSLAFIDGNVVNVALPAIQHEMQATISDAQWVMEAYALFLASLLLVGGALGDRLGRKRVFMGGVALFVLASVGCAMSRTPGMLIATRAVQGIGAALLVPGSLALISAAYPQAQRGAAIGTWSAFSAMASAFGPVLGGALVEHLSWRWAFLVNVPAGVVLVWICMAKVPESRGEVAPGPIDWPGALLVSLGLAGVVFALIEAPMLGWQSPLVAGSGVAGVLALGAFLWVQARSGAPMVPLVLFKERNFAGANLLTLLLYAALGGSLFFLPLVLIQVQGFGATAAGAALFPFIAIIFVLSRWAGALVERTGARLPLVVGPAIAALGFGLLAVPSVGAGYWSGYFPAVCVLGLGMGITVAPLTTTVMNAVGPERAGVASGINNAVSRVGALLAIAVFGVVLTMVFDQQLDAALATLALPQGAAEGIAAQRQKLAAIVLPEGLPVAAAAAARQAINVSFLAGFRWVMLLGAGLALASALSAWWWIAPRAQPEAPQPPPRR